MTDRLDEVKGILWKEKYGDTPYDIVGYTEKVKQEWDEARKHLDIVAKQIDSLYRELYEGKGNIEPKKCVLKFSFEHKKWIAPPDFIQGGRDGCARKVCGFETCHNYGNAFMEQDRLIVDEPKPDEGRLLVDEVIDQEDDETLAILCDKITDQIEQQDCIKTREDAELLATLVVYSHFTDYLVGHDEDVVAHTSSIKDKERKRQKIEIGEKILKILDVEYLSSDTIRELRFYAIALKEGGGG